PLLALDEVMVEAERLVEQVALLARVVEGRCVVVAVLVEELLRELLAGGREPLEPILQLPALRLGKGLRHELEALAAVATLFAPLLVKVGGDNAHSCTTSSAET